MGSNPAVEVDPNLPYVNYIGFFRPVGDHGVVVVLAQQCPHYGTDRSNRLKAFAKDSKPKLVTVIPAFSYQPVRSCSGETKDGETRTTTLETLFCRALTPLLRIRIVTGANEELHCSRLAIDCEFRLVNHLTVETELDWRPLVRYVEV